MIHNNWHTQAAIEIGKKMVARIFAGLLLRFQQKQEEQDYNFSIFDAIPDSETGLFTNLFDVSTGNFIIDGVYVNGNYAFPGVSKAYYEPTPVEFVDGDSSAKFMYIAHDLNIANGIGGNRQSTFYTLSVTIPSGVTHLRVNSSLIAGSGRGNSDKRKSIKFSGSSLEVLDLYKSLIYKSLEILDFSGCPKLKYLRLSRTTFENIGHLVPSNLQISIID